MIAGVVLAAGGARRMGGRPKQCLPCHGEVLVHRAARTLLESGLHPVFVIAAPQRACTQRALSDLTVKMLINPHWARGQSTSVHVAAVALQRHHAEAAVVLPADQPFVPPELVRALVAAWGDAPHPPIVTAHIDAAPSTPVLLDAAIFPHLHTLTGDQGARALFRRFPPATVPWHDARARAEIDTWEDYCRWCPEGATWCSD